MGYKGLALSLAAMAIAVSAPALAQNVHTSRLYEQILENVELALANHRLDSFGVVRLVAGEQSLITIDVPVGVSVQIMGDCDEDCRDLDLIIRDRTGALLAEDRLADYYPIVQFTAPDDRRIEIVMDMVDCDAAYCYAAYSVFVGD